LNKPKKRVRDASSRRIESLRLGGRINSAQARRVRKKTRKEKTKTSRIWKGGQLCPLSKGTGPPIDEPGFRGQAENTCYEGKATRGGIFISAAGVWRTLWRKNSVRRKSNRNQ